MEVRRQAKKDIVDSTEKQTKEVFDYVVSKRAVMPRHCVTRLRKCRKS